ncbi:hypothetical protein MMC18_006395 [Xylographa bjoerkii]|nr:hypothetical protein [Xylographa bjoerkii]
MDLPTLDFAKFLSGSKGERLEVGREIVQSFNNHGFVKLTNHGVPEEVVRNLLKATKQLFSMPQEAKTRIVNTPGPHPQRGWSWVGAEQTAKLYAGNLKETTDKNSEELKDEREFFDAGPPNDAQYPNKWPQEQDLPGFQPLIEQCYEVCQNVSLQIMAAVEVGLGLQERTLVERCIPAASEVRLNHYPPIGIETLSKGTVKRTWPHTDFGIITLLFQDGVGGLELEDRKAPGTFVPVLPGESNAEMIVNISDTFQRWTNGTIRAGLHQVSVPSSMKALQRGVCPDRYSSIFFFKAHRNTSVGPIPQFVTPDRPAAYEDITALQYQQQQTQILY